MNARSVTGDLLRAASTAAVLSCGSVLLANRGMHVAGLATACGAVGAIIARSYLMRLTETQVRIAQLESESLEQRRSIYKLKKDDQDRLVRQTQATRSAAVDETLLAAAVQSIASELNEARLIESIVKNLVATLGVTRVSLHPHDRGSDRFLRGIGAERCDGSIVLLERPVSTEDEAVLRLSLKRRTLLEHDSPDGEIRAAFEVASKELCVAIPLFDRALVTGVLLVFGWPQSRHIVEVLAATASLALSVAHLRNEHVDRSRAPSAPSPANSATTREGQRNA